MVGSSLVRICDDLVHERRLWCIKVVIVVGYVCLAGHFDRLSDLGANI